jgi:hypothetical protein
LGILDEAANEQKVPGLTEAEDKVKFEVYKLALKKIFDSLGNEPTHSYLLEEVKPCLKAMENGLYSLIENGAIQDFNLNNILPIFLEASDRLKAALRKDADSFEFIHGVSLCRSKIFEFIQHLR